MRSVFNIDKKNRCIITVCLWLLIIVCAVSIISFSSDPAHVSREKSGLILEKIEPLVERMIERFDINFINLEDLHFYIRKAAHVFVYFILSILLYLGWRAVKIKGLKAYFSAWIMATIFSIIDEIYQTQIPGRSGEVRDVFLDNVGITLGLLFVTFLFKVSKVLLFKQGKKKSN